MNEPSAESHRIQPHHLERSAYVYVRQSSLRQVAEHLESKRRQYERVDWALAAGWPRERIEVIDEDQGKSGATAKVRPGFARLGVCRICLSATQAGWPRAVTHPRLPRFRACPIRAPYVVDNIVNRPLSVLRSRTDKGLFTGPAQPRLPSL